MSENVKVGVLGVAAAGDTKSNYEFTQDWFQYGLQLWPHLVQHLPKHQRPTFKILWLCHPEIRCKLH